MIYTIYDFENRKIIDAYKKYISMPESGFENKLYGNGDAGENILKELLVY